MRVNSKPKVKLRCAAANDDEDDFGSFAREREPKKTRTSEPSSRAGAETSKQNPPKKAEKEFAWMESDDEEEGAKPVAEQVSQVSEDEATLQNLDAVSSFGRMMLLIDSLNEKLKSGSFGAPELAATCRALARSKFFDGELLEELIPRLQAMILSSKLSVEQVTDVMTCLKELNYNRKDLLSAIAKMFKSKVGSLSATEFSPAVRSIWLEAMRKLGHKSDLEFMQFLEVPPLPSSSPSYGVVRCTFFARGSCESGISCTYVHSLKAPLSLDEGGREDGWKKRSVMMTHDQKYVFKEKDTWGQTAGKNVQQQLLAAQQQQFLQHQQYSEMCGAVSNAMSGAMAAQNADVFNANVPSEMGLGRMNSSGQQ